MGILKPSTYHSCLKWEISWPDIVVSKEITGDNDFAAMRIVDLYRFSKPVCRLAARKDEHLSLSNPTGRGTELKILKVWIRIRSEGPNMLQYPNLAEEAVSKTVQ